MCFLPGRLFHNRTAPKSIDRRTWCSTEASIDGFFALKLWKGRSGISHHRPRSFLLGLIFFFFGIEQLQAGDISLIAPPLVSSTTLGPRDIFSSSCQGGSKEEAISQQTVSQCSSFKMRRWTFLSFIKFVDIGGFWGSEIRGRIGRVAGRFLSWRFFMYPQSLGITASLRPTGPLTILEPRDREIGEFYVVQKHQSTDFQALKSGKGRSGASIVSSSQLAIRERRRKKRTGTLLVWPT